MRRASSEREGPRLAQSAMFWNCETMSPCSSLSTLRMASAGGSARAPSHRAVSTPVSSDETDAQREARRTLARCRVLELHLRKAVPQVGRRLADAVPRELAALDSLDGRLEVRDEVLEHGRLEEARVGSQAARRGWQGGPKGNEESEAKSQPLPQQGERATHRLVEGAVAVVDTDAVLLQEVLLDQARHVERHLVALTERRLADELDNLGELVLLLQDLLGHVAVVQEVGLGRLVVRLQDARAAKRRMMGRRS